jgi:hypothetical protein
VVLDWTTAAIGYGLERTNPLALIPPTVWLPAPGAPARIQDSRFRQTNTITGPANFYRLRKP